MYGYKVNSNYYDDTSFRSMSHIQKSNIYCVFKDNVWTSQVVSYPPLWQKSNGFVVTKELGAGVSNYEYFNTYNLTFDDNNRTVTINTRNGYSWGSTTSQDTYGYVVIDWFFRVPTFDSSYGIVLKNGNQENIVTSEYPLYILKYSGSISIQANTARQLLETPAQLEDEIVAYNIKNNMNFGVIKGGHIVNTTKDLFLNNFTNYTSLDYQVYKMFSASDVENDYGIVLYNSQGQVCYSGDSVLAFSNGVMFDGLQPVYGSYDSTKEAWISLESMAMKTTSSGGDYRTLYNDNIYVVGKDSSGNITAEVQRQPPRSSGSGRLATDVFYDRARYFNVFQ